jgi:hypothetical protein
VLDCGWSRRQYSTVVGRPFKPDAIMNIYIPDAAILERTQCGSGRLKFLWRQSAEENGMGNLRLFCQLIVWELCSALGRDQYYLKFGVTSAPERFRRPRRNGKWESQTVIRHPSNNAYRRSRIFHCREKSVLKETINAFCLLRLAAYWWSDPKSKVNRKIQPVIVCLSIEGFIFCFEWKGYF